MTSNRKASPAGFFDNVKTIAVVGVSQRKTCFGTGACVELKKRGFEVLPLHPSLPEIRGVACYRSPADLPKTPDCVLVAVKPDQAQALVHQFAERGVRKIWFQQGGDFSEAIALAEQLGLQTAHGRCILMYAGEVGGVHSFHRFLNRLFGRY